MRCVNAESFTSQNESEKHRRTKKESEKEGKETLLTNKDAHKQYSFSSLYYSFFFPYVLPQIFRTLKRAQMS